MGRYDPECEILSLSLNCISGFAAPVNDYVRVSPRDHRYLELTNGAPYIPIGLNMISPPDIGKGEEEALKGLDGWLTSLSSNGGNYIRVWLSSPFWDMEHEKSGVYDEEEARRVGRLLEMCRPARHSGQADHGALPQHRRRTPILGG